MDSLPITGVMTPILYSTPPAGYAPGSLGDHQLIVCTRCAAVVAPGPGATVHDAFHDRVGW
jgi:hypothetical protein